MPKRILYYVGLFLGMPHICSHVIYEEKLDKRETPQEKKNLRHRFGYVEKTHDDKRTRGNSQKDARMRRKEK